MEDFALYLFKSSVWLTGFSAVYFLFLRNERFFVLNRIFLVAGILSAIVFPFFTWHYTVIFPVMPTVNVDEPQVRAIGVVKESFQAKDLLLYIYILGALYLVFRLIKQTISVWQVIRKSETLHFNSVKLIRTDRYPASFSFFSFVFVNPSTHEHEINEIVNHEQEHIRQKHWIDLLLFEIMHTMHWFNPVSWLYGRQIRQNHEYLADERALQRSSNPAIYRAALLNQMFGAPVISLANSFNYSLNKKRFNMMKQKTYSPIRKLKLLLVLPLIAGVFYAFATPEYKFLQAEGNTEVSDLPQNTKTVKGKVVTEDGTPLKGTSIVVSGGTIGTMPDDNGNFKLEVPDDSPIVFSFVGFKTVKVKPDFTKEMDITMKRIIVGIDAVGNNPSTPKTEKTNSDTPNSNNDPLIVKNGIIYEELQLKDIDQKSITSINVLKGEAAVKKWGKQGKNGVIELTTTDIPLYVVDGVIVATPNDLDPKSIESVSVLKNESGKSLYGEKAKNGVVLITLKKGQKAIENKNSGVKIRSTGTAGTPLIVVDGVISSQKTEDIDPETIQSVNVLKGEMATKKYGNSGKNGVLEITLKKKDDVFVIVEQMPEFPGGVNALQEYVRVNLQYPEVALENGIQGQVKVGFVVSKTGRIEDVKVISNADPSLDKEAVRIIRSLPKWSPGVQRGQNVDVSFEIPVDFKLPADYQQKNKLKLEKMKNQ